MIEAGGKYIGGQENEYARFGEDLSTTEKKREYTLIFRAQ